MESLKFFCYLVPMPYLRYNICTENAEGPLIVRYREYRKPIEKDYYNE